MASMIRGRRRWRWAVAVVVGAAVVAVGGAYVYTSVIAGDAPPPLAVVAAEQATRPTAAPAASTEGGDDSGRWRVTSGSQAGYRVKEVLFGQDGEAVGRTSTVTGQVAVEGARVTAGSISVDLTTVASDEDRRDAQFHDRIMETSTYPTASFTLTEPFDISSIPVDGAAGSVQAQGELTLHGTTRPVTVDLTVKRGDTIQVSGSIPVTFADWSIPNPSFGPVTTDDNGQIEFLLALARA